MMPEIRPITDLRNTNEIATLCHEKDEPIFITKNGYGDLVIMSLETYDQLLTAPLVDHAIQVSEEELLKDAELINAKEGLAALRRKYFE